MNVPLAVILLILLRIAIPLALVALISYFLHRVEQKWQEKAAKAPKEILEPDAGRDVRRPVHI